MELLLALESYCKMKGLKNFELYQRFSKEKVNPARWDEAFIEQELSKEFAQIKKVLVCGPPVMNETFDRALTSRVVIRGSMINALTFRKEQIEIL
jgi:NAD(P)H-flavin reductase